MDKVYEAKIKAVENVLDSLNDEPFKMAGHYANKRHMAVDILRQLEQVDIDFENRYYEAKVSNAD